MDQFYIPVTLSMLDNGAGFQNILRKTSGGDQLKYLEGSMNGTHSKVRNNSTCLRSSGEWVSILKPLHHMKDLSRIIAVPTTLLNLHSRLICSTVARFVRTNAANEMRV